MVVHELLPGRVDCDLARSSVDAYPGYDAGLRPCAVVELKG